MSRSLRISSTHTSVATIAYCLYALKGLKRANILLGIQHICVRYFETTLGTTRLTNLNHISFAFNVHFSYKNIE